MKEKKQYARDLAEAEIRNALSKSVEKISKEKTVHAGKKDGTGKSQADSAKETQVPLTALFGERGEFASPLCFSLAREMKKAPQALAQELSIEYGKISKQLEFVEGISAQNGYLNFTATSQYFTTAVAQALEMGSQFGSSEQGKGELFVIEYSDPNVGKPFHVGHIRGTILGSAIARLRKFAGYKTFQYAYLGDAGTQVAKLAVALEHFKQMRAAKDEKQLLEYYVKIHEEAKVKPEIEQAARDLLEKIEAGDAKIIAKVSEIKKISMRGFEKNWKRLGAEFDYVTGESAFIAKAKESVSECLRRGLASRDEKDGSVVLELEQYGIPNTILMRSNGTTLYLTRDFPREEFIYELTKKKFGRHYSESLIITASEQNTHFRQLYKCFELLGKPFAPLVKHMGFGLVSLQIGKLSSREGRVIFLEDVLDEAKQLAKNEITSREMPYSEKEVEQIAEQVGVGSVKFAFLRVGSEKNIIYSPEAATRFSGDSGAYLQYTCVRAKNILRKALAEKIVSNEKKSSKEIAQKIGDAELEYNESERKLASLVAEFPVVARNASANFQPHSLCEFLLRVAAGFSEFYENCPVLSAEGEDEKFKRLGLVKATQTVLENGLQILGIEVPEKM